MRKKLASSSLGLFLLLTSLSLAAQTATVSTLTTGQGGLDGISVGPDGAVYVSQFQMNRVWRITESSAEVFLDGLEFPLGSVWDDAGNFYVATGQRIVRRTPDGQTTTFASGFSLASGLTFGPDGTLYAGDYNLDRIATVSPSGVVTTLSNGGSLEGPAGVVIDSSGRVYAGNFDDGNIVRIDGQGNQTVIARPATQTGYIAIDGNDLIYATSLTGNQVRTVTLDGQVELFAGTGAFGSADGPAESAEFQNTNGIGVGPDGTIYVSESGPSGGLRAITQETPNPFQINQGITGSWFFPDTVGSGFFLDYDPSTEFLFATWLTYANEDEGADGTTRWLIGDALATGNVANLTLFRTSGGSFDTSTPVSTTPVGTMEIRFTDCSTAIVSYQLDNGLSGEFSMIRLLPATVALCEVLAEPPVGDP
ncbi:MAG: SMP-30/gluconolactonase/LRE family protein [Pseudomonadota bacterium]